MKIETFEFETEVEYAQKGTELMEQGYFIKGNQAFGTKELKIEAVKITEEE